MQNFFDKRRKEEKRGTEKDCPEVLFEESVEKSDAKVALETEIRQPDMEDGSHEKAEKRPVPEADGRLYLGLIAVLAFLFLLLGVCFLVLPEELEKWLL